MLFVPKCGKMSLILVLNGNSHRGWRSSSSRLCYELDCTERGREHFESDRDCTVSKKWSSHSQSLITRRPVFISWSRFIMVFARSLDSMAIFFNLLPIVPSFTLLDDRILLSRSFVVPLSTFPQFPFNLTPSLPAVGFSGWWKCIIWRLRTIKRWWGCYVLTMIMHGFI